MAIKEFIATQALNNGPVIEVAEFIAFSDLAEDAMLDEVRRRWPLAGNHAIGIGRAAGRLHAKLAAPRVEILQHAKHGSMHSDSSGIRLRLNGKKDSSTCKRL
jgi:hypothetical protein